VAESWAVRWADAWESGATRFNKAHAPAGSPTGGQFASAGGSGSGSASATHKAHVAHVATHPGAGGASTAESARAARKKALLGQAHADRVKAAALGKQLRQLKAQQASAAKTAAHAKAVAAAAKGGAVQHHTAAQNARKKAASHHASLKSRIATLTDQISELNGKAKALEAQAARL